MNYIFTISFRNLFRQKRRNILLGTAIAFGTAILILANAFSHGISDLLFNEIIVLVAGHISVGFTQDGNLQKQVFHDGERMMAIVKKEVPEMTQTQEAIGMFGRAIGNGKSDNVIMVGMDLDSKIGKKEEEQYKKSFKVLEGRLEDLKRTDIEHPVIVSDSKAKYLNIKLNDALKVRFTDINGQQQATSLIVVAIMKPSNVFMSSPIFLGIKDIKKLAGYGPHDIAQIYIRIKDPKKNAKLYADRLHDALKPAFAFVPALMKDSVPVGVMGYRTDSVSLALVNKSLKSVAGKDTAISKTMTLVGSSMAKRFGLKPGDRCTVKFKGKYDSAAIEWPLTISAIVDVKGTEGNVVFVNDKDFYKTFYAHWPGPPGSSYKMPDSTVPLSAVLSREWYLLDRAKTTQDVTQMYKEVSQKRLKGGTVNVQSMYETASEVLNLEVALNLITFIAVMLLFFIILIGVVNTLRMTIRERTREIGTVRAIGMQQTDVRNTFLLESGLLALISAVTGTVVAFCAMWGLTQIKFDLTDNPMAMLLDNGHLHFTPTVGATLFFIFFIIAMAVVTAYFPARKAAKLSAADALRHFE
jgi:ABC-type lipoprotein release transport system permease subunit